MWRTYRIINILNGSVYYGYTSLSTEERLQSHLNHAKWKTTNQILHRAIRKYGPSSFEIQEIGQYQTHEEALLAEQKLIHYHHTNRIEFPEKKGYNMTNGGEGCSGYKHTEETLERLRKKNIGRTWSKEMKHWFSEQRKGEKNPRWGVPVLVETRLKRSMALKGRVSPMKGRKMSEKAREKIAASKKGKKRPKWIGEQKAKYNREHFQGSNNPKAKQWIVLESVNNEYYFVDDLRMFCRLNNINYSSLYYTLKNKRPWKQRWILMERDANEHI